MTLHTTSGGDQAYPGRLEKLIRRASREYLQKTYVLNPFFQAQRSGLASGVYRIRDPAPDVFFQSEYYNDDRIKVTSRGEIGYVTRDWPEGLAEIDA